MGQPKAFAKDEIEKLLQQSSAADWKVVDDSPEATMFVVKGFSAFHMKLDHILVVATDGYLERGSAAKAEAEAAKLTEIVRMARPPRFRTSVRRRVEWFGPF